MSPLSFKGTHTHTRSPRTYRGVKGLPVRPGVPREGAGEAGRRGEAAPAPPTWLCVVCPLSRSFQDLRGMRPGVRHFLRETGLSWGATSKAMGINTYTELSVSIFQICTLTKSISCTSHCMGKLVWGSNPPGYVALPALLTLPRVPRLFFSLVP